MRLVKPILFWAGCFALAVVLAMAQQPVGLGPASPETPALEL